MEESEEETIRRAMSLMGRRRTPAQTEARRENAAKASQSRKGQPISDEHKENLRIAQAARRERERAQRDAISPPAPKRPRGRPKKTVSVSEQEGQEVNG